MLSLSWCQQDSDLLLSCGKDNRTICWNTQTGEPFGEFPIVTNWTFQTRWNPYNPNLLATASFDGRLSVQTVQNTKTEIDQSNKPQNQALDGEDFFAKAQSQPQTASFSLPKAPKWLERPCGTSFGFGGKIISFSLAKGDSRHSTVHISSFAIDNDVGTSTESFEKAMSEHDLKNICESKISKATFEVEKTDWKVIETLISDNPRNELISYLGFSSSDEAAEGLSKLMMNGHEGNGHENNGLSAQKDGAASRTNRLSAFFDNNNEGDSNFLSDLAATKGAKTNNPFHVYSGGESEADRRITRALLLGQFEKAMQTCLHEDRMSDAFMVAICGGQKCIDLVQKAYFTMQAKGPNYLRLLASVVGKNLWDVVYNADLENWKEVMAALCTYASAEEFPDLCEALGDRLEEQMKDDDGNNSVRKDASFCYLAGSKLEKVVGIWIADLEHSESSGSQDESNDSTFSVHARSLQNFIEKVTVFREVTHYRDNDRRATADWKLALLYEKYTEYADLVAAHGQLKIAEKYLDMLPEKYPAAEIARNRVRQATRKTQTQPVSGQQPQNTAKPIQRSQTNMPNFEDRRSPVPTPITARSNPYTPSSVTQTQNPYAPSTSGPYDVPAYQQSQQMQLPIRQQPGMNASYGAPPKPQTLGPPPRSFNASPSIAPPSKAQNATNWNDTPEDFFKPPTSRRGTPGVGATAVTAPFPNQPSMPTPPTPGQPFGAQQRPTPPAPPPKGPAQPPRMTSPLTNGPASYQQPERPSSSTANMYAPQQTINQLGPSQQQTNIPRGPSPYNAPPSGPPPSNRYAPAPASQIAAPSNQAQVPMSSMGSRQGPPPPNPFLPQQNYASPQLSSSNQQQYGGPPQPFTPSQDPPAGPSQEPRPSTAQSQQSNRLNTPAASKYRELFACHLILILALTIPIAPGDRSHIPAGARPIYEILNEDMQRVKSKAPVSFKPHVNDAEKRLNILFDHLNNEDLLKPETVQDMVQLAQALRLRDYAQAHTIHIEIMMNKTNECGNWMVR